MEYIPVITEKPKTHQIIELRELVRLTYNVTVPQARVICAATIGVSQRAWQRWEVGGNPMSAGLWELALIKLKTGTPESVEAKKLWAAAQENLRERVEEKRAKELAKIKIIQTEDGNAGMA